MTTQTTDHASCPECAAEVRFDGPPMENEIVDCGDCGAELEVRGTAPLALEVAPEVEEDWGE